MKSSKCCVKAVIRRKRRGIRIIRWKDDLHLEPATLIDTPLWARYTPLPNIHITLCRCQPNLSKIFFLDISDFALDPLHCHLEQRKRQEYPKPSLPQLTAEDSPGGMLAGKWIKRQ